MCDPDGPGGPAKSSVSSTMSRGDPRLQFTELPLLLPSLNVRVQVQPVWNREPTICPPVT
jgi:hypothetical protein